MRRALRISAVLFMLGAGVVALAGPASATTSAETTTTTIKATTPASDKTWPWLSAAALGVGVVGAAAVFLFVRRESEASQKTTRMAIRLKVPAKSDIVHPYAGAEALVQGGKGKGAGPPPAVGGESEAEVGKEYTYTATVGNAAKPATWTVNPEDAAEVRTDATGAHVTFQKAGTFRLTATVQGSGSSPPKEVTVAAPQPSSQTWSIPFLGEGWGSIVVAIFVAGLVTALGFVRILNGEALAGFYGALIGYVFHKAAGEKSDKGGGDDSSGKGSKPATGGGKGGT